MAESVYRKVMARVVLVLTGLIVLSSIDRVNVSFAAIQMNAALGLDPRSYGLGVGIFFVGYLLFQLPSTAMLRRIGPRRWIAGSVIGWGMAATAMAGIDQPWQFYLLRFVTGVFESGFAPGVVWYVSQWLPQAYRSRSVGLTLLAVPTSVILSGPLSGWLLGIDTGLPGWRLMFLVEGLATVAAGLWALRWFSDTPAAAGWLDANERDWIFRSVGSEQDVAGQDEPFSATLRRPALWWCAALWFVLITGANAIIFWLPIAIKTLGVADPFHIGVLSALPWVAIGTGMILVAWRSDRTNERFGHITVAMLLAASGFGAAAMIGGGLEALLLLTIGGLGLGGAQSVFWSVPTRLLGQRHPQMMAVINLFGNLSGAVAPVVIGWIIAETGNVLVPVYLLAGLLLAGVLIVIPLRRIAKPARQSVSEIVDNIM
ncbi:MFS transporter [Sphingomonas metalli]|uniref:MFS transporter n=1 Tax=Sphingomonas metalli TaxID=1779358 RepID=A0A916T1C4_9SPHN|nr:MFS transporter [Sphingomonas metalli]